MNTKPTRYIGRDCTQGHGGERYTSNWRCVKCHQIKKQAAKKAERLANPKKLGRPTKPNNEKVYWKWDPTPEQIEHRRQYQKEYWARPENAGKKKSKRAKARAKAELRIPAWLSDDDKWMIDQAYELAAIRSKLFEFQWDVDHVIPMKGKLVSGLHVPTNLQVIPHVLNVRKYNLFTP
jgi:hypothetical protein